MKSLFRTSTAISALVVASALALPASAQNAGIEEVVVTAQKRSQSVNDVSTTITAYTGQKLEQLGVTEPLDLAQQTPGLLAKNSPNGASQVEFFLRGVGLTDFTSTTNPSVGVYVDEIFKPAAIMLNFAVFDVERVEVLKGPQGTLYGRNSTAGAVNFITRAPTKELEGYVRAGYANYETFDLEAAVSGPLTDTLSARLSYKGHYSSSDGYFTNDLTGDELGKAERTALRGQFLWEPTERFDARLIVNYGEEDSDTALLEHVSTRDANNVGVICAPVINGVRAEGECTDFTGYFDSNDDVRGGSANFPNDISIEDINFTLAMNYDFSRFTLTSVTGYQDFERQQNQDIDASPLVQADNPNGETIDVFSQEIRLTSDESFGFDWIVGAFYSYDKVDFFQSIDLTDVAGIPTSNGALQKTESAAGFAQVGVPLSDQFKLVGGIRFTHEKRRWQGATVIGTFNNLDEAFAAGAPVLSQLPLPANNPLAGTALDFPTQVKANNFDYKAVIEYRPTDDILLFGGYSEGFRSGGYSSAVIFSQDALEPYEPENLRSLEIGWKISALDRTLQFNGSGFYYDYQDYQANFVLTGEPNSRLQNVGDVEIFGLEGDLTWLPTDGLTLQLGAIWLDNEIVKSDVVLTPYDGGPAETIKGNELANAPEISLNGLVRYEFDAADSLRIGLQTDFNYTGDHYLEPNNREILSENGYFIMNARASLFDADNTWEVAAWVKNLTNTDYKTAGFDLAGALGWNLLSYNPPRTYGVEATYRF